jgi:hypothetical protein
MKLFTKTQGFVDSFLRKFTEVKSYVGYKYGGVLEEVPAKSAGGSEL